MKFFKEKNLFQVIYEGKEGYVIIDKTEITNIKDHYGKYYLEKSNIINQFPDYLTDLDECKIIIASTFPLGDLPQFVIEDELENLVNLCKELLIDKDLELAVEKLPTQEGFFFGGIEYDEYYWHSLEETLKMLKPLIEEGGNFYYQSSW